MAGYKELEIYQLAFQLAIKVHKVSLSLPNYELFEQGSQIRRSSKSIKDTIAEGYGRRRYKAEYVKFLVYSQASCDETLNQLETLAELYPGISEIQELRKDYEILGKKINNFLQWVDGHWNEN